jgi:4-hydroxybenzoate polyprenyltransferase
MLSLGQSLLPVLQLTRMALVFTAIADSLCALLLWARYTNDTSVISAWRVLGITLASVGLYGFGMSLNDIIDRRRDKHLAAHRPIPSGRISLVAAYLICLLLAGLTLIGAAVLYATSADSAAGWASILLIFWTAGLIAFYDLAGKYLVAVGLLTLGFIRFFHAMIAAPQWPLVWHPLLLLDHVAILSAVAYKWEQKRPSLTDVHWRAVVAGLVGSNVLIIGLVLVVRHRPGSDVLDALWIQPGLVLPAVAAIIFGAVAYSVYWWSDSPRQAGQNVMLYGLLWLIVYDACFVAGYVDWVWSLGLLALLPVSFLSVQAMRWWSRVMALSQKPAFKRAEAR